MIGALIAFFTVLLYTALGTYVLAKNPGEGANKLFALLMATFIIWSIGTYNIGLNAGRVPPEDVIIDMKIQFSGVVLAITMFFLLAISISGKERVLRNPLFYLAIIPMIYILYIIWTFDISQLIVFSPFEGKQQELFLYSTVFSVAGVYLLLRHYATSKYREKEQARLILIGAFASILMAISFDIILPMFFNIFFLEFTTLAPAVMSTFFTYAVYQYGLFLKPMPEISVTSFCGADCTICNEYFDENCRGCRFDKERYNNCELYKCVIKKGYTTCGDCPEIIQCLKRNGKQKLCFLSNPRNTIISGKTFIVKGSGFELFLDTIRHGAFGLIVSTMHPQQLKEKYGFTTTPIVWISDEIADKGVRYKNLVRLNMMIANFMKKIGNAVVLIDGIDELIMINGTDNMLLLIKTLDNVTQSTGSRLIIHTELEGEILERLKNGREHMEIKNYKIL